jgi:hypothetical protein
MCEPTSSSRGPSSASILVTDLLSTSNSEGVSEAAFNLWYLLVFADACNLHGTVLQLVRCRACLVKPG